MNSPFRTNNQTFFPSETTTTNSNEPQLISCSESQCQKRFVSNIALSYHISNAHKKTQSTSSTVSQANTRDEEDVAHILANVADYVRRSSPPSSIRSSPDHQSSGSSNSPLSTMKPLENSTLSWPCPQISSNLVLSSSLNNTETNIVDNQNKFDQDSIKTADHFLLHIQDETNNSLSSPSSTNYIDLNLKKESITNIKPPKIPTPPPTSSSPAYSDISDEDPTPNEQSLPPSTINLLTATNGKIDENGNNLHSSSFLATNGGLNSSTLPNPAWTTAQMLFQQFGSFIQPQQALSTAAVTNNKDLSTTPNR